MNHRICKRATCKNKFIANQIYCSISCAVKVNNSKRTKIVRYCVICNRILSNRARVVCSKICEYDKKYKNYISKWLSGEISGGNWFGVSGYVKEWLKRTYGESCVLCKWNKTHKITGLIPLHVDHINGNPDDHKPKNLRLLCPNCHSLTPTYGGLNFGNGRKERRHYSLIVKQSPCKRQTSGRNRLVAP